MNIFYQQQRRNIYYQQAEGDQGAQYPGRADNLCRPVFISAGIELNGSSSEKPGTEQIHQGKNGLKKYPVTHRRGIRQEPV